MFVMVDAAGVAVPVGLAKSPDVVVDEKRLLMREEGVLPKIEDEVDPLLIGFANSEEEVDDLGMLAKSPVPKLGPPKREELSGEEGEVNKVEDKQGIDRYVMLNSSFLGDSFFFSSSWFAEVSSVGYFTDSSVDCPSVVSSNFYLRTSLPLAEGACSPLRPFTFRILRFG